MSRQRPTLKLADWKIAIHLAATRSVQDHPSYPAHGCECGWCNEWSRLYSEVLPLDLVAQFNRIGILPEHPTDLYNYKSDSVADYLRVVFCFVGRIMSGPDAWVQDGEHGAIRKYYTLREEPVLSLVVHRHEELGYATPTNYDPKTGQFLLADFRLAIPFAISTASSQNKNAQSGRRGDLTPAPHTTGHTGP